MGKTVKVQMVRGPDGDEPRDWAVGPPFLPEGYLLGAEPTAVSEAAAEILLDPENEELMSGRTFRRVGGHAAKVADETAPPVVEVPAADETPAPTAAATSTSKGTSGPAYGVR